MEDREQFARDNFGLVYAFIKQYKISSKFDDIFDVLLIGYSIALNMYDKDKGEFSTLAFKCMQTEYYRYLHLNKMAKRDSSVKVISLNTTITNEEEDELIDFVADETVNVDSEVTDNILYKYIIDAYPLLLTEKERVAFEGLCLKGQTAEQLAKKYNTTKQAVNLLKQKGLAKLRKYFENDLRFKEPTPLIKNNKKKTSQLVPNEFALTKKRLSLEYDIMNIMGKRQYKKKNKGKEEK